MNIEIHVVPLILTEMMAHQSSQCVAAPIPSQKAPPFPVNTFLSWNSNGYIKVNSFKHARPFVHYRFWAILMFLTGNTDKP